MCGIVGFQGPFDVALLEAMSRAVAHRGPDGHGAQLLGHAGRSRTGLAHRRLAIIDLSMAGCQPMQSVPDRGGAQQAGLTIVFNGEIYNYRELRDALRQDGHDFRTATDTEVLLHLYERDGLAMVDALNGIFAFALHDAREHGRPEGVERGDVFLVRDQLGVKPLYYAALPEGMLFASEIKAIAEYAGLPREINASALHQTLAYLWTPAPDTALTAVKKLEGGCAMLVRGGQVARSWRYYELPYDGTRRRESESTLAVELAQRVETAVRRQLVADVPVGAFLSGGLDSSSVVAMMRRVQPDVRPTCFCIGFDDDGDIEGNPNDMPYARRVAKHLDVALEEVHVRPDIIGRLGEMISLLDEPQADPAPINALIIAEHARAHGIPVLLSGAGGDDIFSGYRRHRALGFERMWGWLPSSARGALQSLAVRAGSGGASGFSDARVRRAAKAFSYAGLDGDRRLISYFWWSTESLRRGLYTPMFAEQVRHVDTAAPLLASLARIPAERDPLQRMLFLETKHFLADHNLNYTDRTGMATGVEVRVPLLDRDLVAFAASVPPAFKQRGSVGKSIFKKAMEPYLPHDVIYRGKSGFGVPLRRWLARELRPQVEDTLNEGSLRRRGIFEPSAVRRLVELDRNGRVDGAYTIFALMCIELWCRRFVDGTTTT